MSGVFQLGSGARGEDEDDMLDDEAVDEDDVSEEEDAEDAEASLVIGKTRLTATREGGSSTSALVVVVRADADGLGSLDLEGEIGAGTRTTLTKSAPAVRSTRRLSEVTAEGGDVEVELAVVASGEEAGTLDDDRVIAILREADVVWSPSGAITDVITR